MHISENTEFVARFLSQSEFGPCMSDSCRDLAPSLAGAHHKKSTFLEAEDDN